MPYSVARIANTWLDYVENDNPRKALNNMKLQKLLYFTQGWHLAVYDRKCFNETIEAWDYGPVIGSIYHQFKQYAKRPIEVRAYTISPVEIAPNVLHDQQLMGIIEGIWEVYHEHSAIQLSHLTHKEGTPWDITVKEIEKKYPGEKIQGFPISTQKIKDYYKKFISSNEAEKQG